MGLENPELSCVKVHTWDLYGLCELQRKSGLLLDLNLRLESMRFLYLISLRLEDLRILGLITCEDIRTK